MGWGGGAAGSNGSDNGKRGPMTRTDGGRWGGGWGETKKKKKMTRLNGKKKAERTTSWADHQAQKKASGAGAGRSEARQPSYDNMQCRQKGDLVPTH